MNSILFLETSLNIYFQGLGTFLLPIMQFFSFLGTEQCFLLIIPLIYWTMDVSLGIRLALMLLLSGGINTIIKFAFHLPRPYWINPDVKALAGETSFGFPSGHSQISLSVFGLLGISKKNKPLISILSILIIFIGISRAYLGVHFLTDVLGGWLIGFGVLLLFIKFEKYVASWFFKHSFSFQLLFSFFSSLLLLLVTFGIQSILQGWETPIGWVANIQSSNFPQTYDPLNPSGMIAIAGMWFGTLAGFSWYRISFKDNRINSSPTNQMIMNIIGLIGLFFLWYGLGMIFPNTPEIISSGLRYFRYFFVGIWITGAAPTVFRKLKLRNS